MRRTSNELFRTAASVVRIVMKIANVRRGEGIWRKYHLFINHFSHGCCIWKLACLYRDWVVASLTQNWRPKFKPRTSMKEGTGIPLPLFSNFSGVMNSSPIGSPKVTVLNISGRKANLRISLKLGKWNTRSFFEPRKLTHPKQGMYRLKLDIMGVVEIWWSGTGLNSVEKGSFFCCDNEDQNLY